MDARQITVALKGTWHGQYGTVCCPAHEDRSPSLSIQDSEDGRLLLHCFAGCSYAVVRDALVGLGVLPAIQGSRQLRSPARPSRRSLPRRRAEFSVTDASATTAHTDFALALWASSRPAAGTLVESYLTSRNLCLPHGDSLRFHPSLKHPSGSWWPAMVALVTRGHDGQPIGIHRTFLTRDGSGKAPIDPDRMMLGRAKGGAVRLAEAGERVMVGEGIETCLSVMQVMEGIPAWAALSTSGLTSLNLPASVREVTILADGDEPGERAARTAAERWTREGRRVRIARPPQGTDFNDLLRRRAAKIQAVRA